MTATGSSAPSRDVALRLALAARALPEVELQGFVNALGSRLGTPLTADKLARVTVEDLFRIVRGPDEIPDTSERQPYKQAVRFLWGEDIDDADAPRPEACPEAGEAGSIRVAVASNSGENLDGHFGSCLRFLVYQVSPQHVRLVDVRSTRPADDAEDRNVARAAMIGDCAVLYSQSIGGPAAAKVVRAGVHPVKWPSAGPAADALLQLQTTLASPPPWLARALGVKAGLERFLPESDQ